MRWLSPVREGQSLQKNHPRNKWQVERPCHRAKSRRGKELAWRRLQVEQLRRILDKGSSCGVLVHFCDLLSGSRTQRLRDVSGIPPCTVMDDKRPSVNSVIHRLNHLKRPPR